MNIDLEIHEKDALARLDIDCLRMPDENFLTNDRFQTQVH